MDRGGCRHLVLVGIYKVIPYILDYNSITAALDRDEEEAMTFLEDGLS